VITATNPSPVGMGVGRGSTKESRLEGLRRVHEPPSRKSSKARAKASAPPREKALDDDDDPLHDVQHSVQSGGMTWRMLIPSEQGLRGKAGISSLGSTVGMNDVVDSAEYQFLQREREEESRVEQSTSQAKTGDDLVWLSDTRSSAMAEAMSSRIKDCADGALAAFATVRGGPRRKCFNSQRKSCTGDQEFGLSHLADELDLDPEDLPMAPPTLGSRPTKSLLELDKLQAELDAGAFMDIDRDDDGTRDLIGSAEISELVPKPFLTFHTFEHVRTWMQLWGAQNQPMKMLPGGGKSKRVYVCRHPAFGKWSMRQIKKGEPPACSKPACKSKLKKTATSTTCPATAESLAATEVCAG